MKFISELGGILGLFIGFSFVTIFELAELLIEICFIFFGNYHQKSSEQNERNDEISFEEEIKRLKNELNDIKKNQNEANSKIELLLKSKSKKKKNLSNIVLQMNKL